MKSAQVIPRKRGNGAFTLIELVAAIVSGVVVLGAATGFMITAFARQKVVLDAVQLEASHDTLANILSSTIKTANGFQIFVDRKAFEAGRYGPGVPLGNFLSCWREDANGQHVESDFEFVKGQIVYTLLVGASLTTKTYYSVEPGNGSTVFNMKLGLVQAAWNVVTSIDLVPYRVYAMPLDMR
ncbi:MAG: hypothetical protein WB586_03950 [Chthoniobacterales bacterium]